MHQITPIFVLAGDELTVKFIPAALEPDFNNFFHEARSKGAKGIDEEELEAWLKSKI